MHTLKVIALGLGLLALCLLGGRLIGGGNTAAGLINGAKLFLPLWVIGAGINMWLGVSKAGYSVRDEAPVFLIVFGVPAAVAVLAWWRVARG
jgi:hypothetical protein